MPIDAGIGPMHLVLNDEGREYQCFAGSALHLHMNEDQNSETEFR